MPKRVLIVDDAVFMRNMIKDIFSGSGFEVVGEAANGLEAVDKHKELAPDLTTMDIVMPFKSGIEATREIVTRDPKALIVMCSALGQESLVMEAIEAGASDFIVKPFKSGIEATREIVARDPKALIVMCSALGQESLVMEAIEAGASDFIVKPFKAEDVLAVVKKVLGQA